MHIFLYILLILQPITGIVMSQLSGYPVKVYGLFTLPDFFGKNPALGKVFSEAHSVIATVLAISIVIHVAAALKHHYHRPGPNLDADDHRQMTGIPGRQINGYRGFDRTPGRRQGLQ